MNLANTWMLWFLVPLAVAAWRVLRRARNVGIKFSAVGYLPKTRPSWRTILAAMTPFILLAGLTLLIVAAARPRTPVAHESRSVNAIAIMMAVDISGSMDALDLTPDGQQFSKDTTRLNVVKKVFAEFVEKRPDDLIGLVTFGGYASTRVPLTADHESLIKSLGGVKIPTIQEETMTAVGDGLSVSLLRLKEAQLKSKIVILLSDGESNVGAVTPEDAAKAAAEMGVKVYTIGVGTNSAQTPYIGRDFFGRETIVYANTTFNEGQLKSIAETTGGRYFAVNDHDALEEALKEIDELETTKIDADSFEQWNEHFSSWLFIGTILVLVAVSLSMVSRREVM